MAKKWNITIGRQCGSGGHEIGLYLAEKLGQPCYDRELLHHVAEESGFSEELLSSFDEKPRSFLYAIATDPMAFTAGGATRSVPVEQQVYLATFDTIRKLAVSDPGIFVGRCADYILRDTPDLLRIFICAPLAKRVAHVQSKYALSDEEAKLLVQRTDKRRSSYYNYYATRSWGDVNAYDLCLDSSLLGLEGTGDFILELLERLDGN